MPHKPKRIAKLALTPFIIALGGLPAIAEPFAPDLPSNAALSVIAGDANSGITWGQPGSRTGSIPPEVWGVMQSQTGNLLGDTLGSDTLGSYGDIFRGSHLPENIWSIDQTQIGLPESVGQIFSNRSNGAPGSIPSEVWNVMQSQVGFPETFGNSGLDGI